jgi:formylglycine-generating enzyme required for sulfatase activity
MKIVNRHAVLFAVIALLSALPAIANNITVGTPTLTGINTTSDIAYVQFSLSWENSWRDDVNWDAAWVFVKYRVGNGEWQHAYLNGNASGHTIPSGYTCSVGMSPVATNVNRGMGVFIYRNASGSGNTNLSNVRLLWNYAANGVPDFASVTIKVFAVEMVYVPQGAFYVGDADLDVNAGFYTFGTTGPYRITSEGAITIGQNAGNLWAKDGNYVEASTLPAAFPKGYNAFYCMKYEISQGQWVDFFNTLKDAQKVIRDITGNVSVISGKNSDGVVLRNTVSWTTGNAACTRPDRACNYLSWGDDNAYADWASLRPMTELEFVKACRGTQPVVDDEFAWGTKNITKATMISGTENGTETITNSGANCCFGHITFTGGDAGQGPLRCGIFAKPSATREQAGASFYGIKELAGNLSERCVPTHSSAGRSYTGSHGDGSLGGTGNANTVNWPAWFATDGCLGGDWENGLQMEVANRGDITWGSIRTGTTGFRCVRSAP